MTIIRDINGNRTTKTLSHYLNHCSTTSLWHQDSTGLYVVDYRDGHEKEFSAFIRPDTGREENAVEIAKQIGAQRQ